MSYPQVPVARRQPLTRIGARFFRAISANSIIEGSLSDVENIDDETNSQGLASNGVQYYALRMPYQFDLSALYIASPSNALNGLQVSDDSSNGWDGSWSNLSNAGQSRDVVNTWRNGIQSFTATGINWLRIRNNTNSTNNAGRVRAFHVFGGWSPASNVDRLEFWHPTLNEPLDGTYFNFGNIVQGYDYEREFRIKNRSPFLLAKNVTLGLYRQNSVMEYSADGGATWFAALTIGDIVADDIVTTVFKVRRVVSPTANLGVGAGVLTCVADSWVG